MSQRRVETPRRAAGRKRPRRARCRLRHAALLVVLALGLAPAAWAADLARGRFLVASERLGDPNFAQTVVLLIEYDVDGTVGLVINRQATLALGDLFPDDEVLAGSEDPIFIGGPVERHRMMMLFQSAGEPPEAERIFDQVFVSGSRELLVQLSLDTAGPRLFRVYSGYAGWAPGQLEHEIARGDWHVLVADPDVLFDEAPDGVWRGLILRTGVQLAGM